MLPFTVIDSGTLPVPGATLYWQRRGQGPLLLVLQGGAGDADGSNPLAELLADRFQVLSCDRRGLSRSPIDGGQGVPGLQVHTDDVHALLEALGAGPALVLGVSIGAMIGLDLLARYPERVARLICFEAPLTQLLPEPQRSQMIDVQLDLEATFAREGARAAMLKFMAALGNDFRDFEPGFALPPPNPYLAGNYEHFLRWDAVAARTFQLDLDALGPHAARIVPALGARTLEALIEGRPGAALKASPTLVLAARFQLDVRVFPGGHGAYATWPRAFAERLRGLLT